MSAAAVDPRAVTVPTGDARVRRTVADLGDSELLEHANADREHIARLAREYGHTLDADGLPAGELDEDHGGELTRGAARSINRASRRVRAIREELERRARANAERAASAAAEARERLERLMRDGPEAAAELASRGEEVLAAFGRVQALVADLELLASASRLNGAHDSLRTGVRAAAEALTEPKPPFAAMPRLPDEREVARLIVALVGPGVEALRDLELPAALRNATRAQRDAATLRKALEEE